MRLLVGKGKRSGGSLEDVHLTKWKPLNFQNCGVVVLSSSFKLHFNTSIMLKWSSSLLPSIQCIQMQKCTLTSYCLILQLNSYWKSTEWLWLNNSWSLSFHPILHTGRTKGSLVWPVQQEWGLDCQRQWWCRVCVGVIALFSGELALKAPFHMFHIYLMSTYYVPDTVLVNLSLYPVHIVLLWEWRTGDHMDKFKR